MLLQEPALERLAMDYAQAAWDGGWRGLFNLQARRNASGGYVRIELAGRFMGGTNALHRLGIPVAAIVFARFIPGFDINAAIAPRFDARAVKQISTHVVGSREQESSLRDAGVWRRG